MFGLRNLYKVFNETRKAAREQATLAVTGDSARAAEIAALLGAQTSTRGAEVILAVSDTAVTISGKAIEDPGEIPLPADRLDLLEGLSHRIVRALDEDYLVPLAKGYPPLRQAACEELVRNNARQNAVIGALPIPGADMPVMTANQARMVLNLAAAFGEDLSMARARELLGVLAAGFGLRALSRQVVKLVPVGGWAASAAIGYAGTVAMGRATMLYFERGGQKVGAEEMEAIRDRAAEEAKTFVSRLRRR
ncbi:MAG: YcjF family protein [Rubrobacter sp.]